MGKGKRIKIGKGKKGGKNTDQEDFDWIANHTSHERKNIEDWHEVGEHLVYVII